MKSNAQISALLKTMIPHENKDELAIEAFLARQGIYIKIPPVKEGDDKNKKFITFEQFEEWFEKELPSPGEIIVMNGLLGVVKGTKADLIILGAYLDEEMNFTPKDTELPIMSFRKAGKEEKIKLQRAFNRNNLSWNQYHNRIYESVRAQNNLQLRISLLGEKLGIGVFKEINEKGEIVMYCIKENEAPIRYSLHEIIGAADDFQIEPMNNADRKKLASDLEKAGKVWNGHAKRIEPNDFRSVAGSTYHYIDDYLEIRTAIDNYKPKDHKRFRSGNYFRSFTNAEAILNLIIETRNIQLSQDSGAIVKKKKGSKR
ncbi:MAG: hypothetical protein LBS20_11755 [Prevotella sp.]|jgi:hypothetical protein|nr:hypothetical protein [Prevotella sp.]